eukprot:3613842-Rhodomonas_salina.1
MRSQNTETQLFLVLNSGMEVFGPDSAWVLVGPDGHGRLEAYNAHVPSSEAYHGGQYWVEPRTDSSVAAYRCPY